MKPEQQFGRECFFVGDSFYGEIWEDDADVPMQKGYSNEGRPFDIQTACYLIPVFQAIKNPVILEIAIRAAVQTLKTFVVEKSASYFIKHHPGDMAVYDCDIEAASDHAKSRLGPMLHSVPGIAEMIGDVESRHDITTTEFYLPGMTLRLWPLNESATQRITLRYVFISDAFLSKRTGKIGEAKARTTQHSKDKKIIIESQGSDEGDDFDLEFAQTNQQTLHVKCPLCGEGQPFEWERVRDDGTYAGFNRGPDSEALLENGEYNEKYILENTFYECYHCKGKWLDIPETRAKLDESSYYVAQNPNADPSKAGFSWPAWINRRLKWGALMLEYLIAKKAVKEFGYNEKFKQWWQKRAAKSWSERITRDPTPIQVGGFDPNAVIENEHHRGMIIDCQKHPVLDTVGSFWYEVYAADKLGNSFQLDRGFITSKFPDKTNDAWEALDAIQAKWKIPNRYVAIDGRKWNTIILQQVAARAVWTTGFHQLLKKQVGYWQVWKVLLGDGLKRNFKHGRDGQFRVWSPPQWRDELVVKDGKRAAVRVFWWLWSNMSIKDQLSDLIIGGEGRPKFVAAEKSKLSTETQKKEVGDFTYEEQMSSEIRDNGQWTQIKKQNHYWDIACMRLVRMAQEGLAGHVAVTE